MNQDGIIETTTAVFIPPTEGGVLSKMITEAEVFLTNVRMNTEPSS